MARDLRLATATDLPVLISGPPAASREIACELDRRSRFPGGAVAIVDCREQGALSALQSLTHDDVTQEEETPQVRILLLQEVHALDPLDQALLEKDRRLAHAADTSLADSRVIFGAALRPRRRPAVQ